MQYRNVGRWGVKISEVGLGSWLTYGGSVDEESARACIKRAYDLGVTFFDTANVYARGRAEEIVGRAVSGFRRDSIVLATKVFFPMGEGPNDRGLSRKHVMEQAHLSLKRLGVDYVDLYQCHRYDPETPLEETMQALTEVVRAGKARYIGFSEWSPQNIADAFAIPGVERFVSSQPQYSLLWRRPEQKVIPLCREKHVSQIVWSPLAQGVLTGKYLPGAKPAADTRAASDTMSQPIQGWMRTEILEAVQTIKPIAKEAGCTLGQFALAWVLREPNVASAIVGASRPAQLVENIGASGLSIDPVLFKKAEEIVAKVQRTR